MSHCTPASLSLSEPKGFWVLWLDGNSGKDATPATGERNKGTKGFWDMLKTNGNFGSGTMRQRDERVLETC